MKFGPIPLGEADGAILAHSIRLADRALKKGRILDGGDLDALHAAGHDSVVAVRLEDTDLDENEAAKRVAEACARAYTTVDTAFTGRANIRAARAGVLVVMRKRVHALNAIDEAVTLSTIAPYETVALGQLVATVKIITFGVAAEAVERCVTAVGAGIVGVAPFRPTRVGLVQTRLPGSKESVLDKTVETTRVRLGALGLGLDREIRCGHDVAEVATALKTLGDGGCDIALVLGASAIVDRRDVVPAAVERADGAIEHFGMPVDPGNLMLLAHRGKMRVLGLPGSARSPRLHGFDWVLQRLAAGIKVTGRDLMGMGVGGLLKEIPSRPMPRGDAPTATTPRPRIAAIVLAAGQSRRAGAINKLLVEIDGAPMVARVLETVRAAEVDPVIVVLGHEPDRVRGALAGHDVTLVENPDYANGLSTSLGRGIAALPREVDGVVVCLGDMPDVKTSHIERLIEAFGPAEGRDICVPTFNGKRGNPVLWARRYFDEIAGVAGDVGARHLIGEYADSVSEVAMSDGGVLLDLDTPEALAAHARAREGGK